MRSIEVAVLDDHFNPSGMMMFLAKLTQRGHAVKNMEELLELQEKSMAPKRSTVEYLAALPHGTIKRFTPITVAVVGASRRFLAQARTHQVGFNYVSASLQYSDYTDKGSFVVPYDIISKDHENNLECSIWAQEHMQPFKPETLLEDAYLTACEDAMYAYKELAYATDNDTAGYIAPQGLRNILIMQGNHEAWLNFLRARTCNRNTKETQYVALLIWQALLDTISGKAMFKYAGPDCLHGTCREGKMCCGDPEFSHRPEGDAPTGVLERRFSLAYNHRRT